MERLLILHGRNSNGADTNLLAGIAPRGATESPTHYRSDVLRSPPPAPQRLNSVGSRSGILSRRLSLELDKSLGRNFFRNGQRMTS